MPDPPPAPPAPSVSEVARRLGPAGVVGVLWTVLPPLGSIALFAYMNTVGEWLRGHEQTGLAVYVAGFAVLAGCALLPTYASAILGGWAFGFAAGYPAALAGFLGGSVIGFVIARGASADCVVGLIEERPQWRAVRDALIGGSVLRTTLIIAMLRLPPNSPFALTNLLLASVKVRPLAFVAGTLAGMAPRTGVVVWIAAQLSARSAADAASEKKPVWLIASGVVLGLVVLGVLYLIANHAISRLTGRHTDTQETAEA